MDASRNGSKIKEIKEYGMENRIRELREKRRMNQETLAGFVGVSQQTISKVERNTEALCIGLLIEISDFFSVTTDYLLGLSDEKRNLLMENRVNRKIEHYYDLIVEFEELNENNKNTINVMIRALKAAQNEGVL